MVVFLEQVLAQRVEVHIQAVTQAQPKHLPKVDAVLIKYA